MDGSEDDILDNVDDASGYMIQRINVDNAAQLLGTEILQTSNGLVVELGGDFIPVNYTSDDLLAHDLTEEDRNLATSLVAVQINQQQKQQQETNVIINSNLPSLVTTLDGSKVRLTDQVLVQDKQTGLIQIVNAEELYKHDFAKYDDGNHEIHLIKTRNDDDEEEEEVAEEANVSLVAVEPRKVGRKSLPHKKRIARKVKRNERATTVTKVQKCTFCDDLFRVEEIEDHQVVCQANITSAIASANTFSCQLCSATFGDQLSFFEHLKKHYEPPQDDQLIEQEMSHEIIEEETIGQQSDEIVLKPEEDIEEDEEEETIIKIETSDDGEQKDKLLSSILQLICLHCNKTFRRHKSFEAHMRDVHNKTLNEFNDDDEDDLMAGIDVHHSDDKEWYPDDELHATEEDLKELEAKDHACPNCQQLFPMRSALLQHLETCGVEEHVVNTLKVPTIKTTKGERKPVKYKKNSKNELECTICGRKFFHRNSLVYHMRSHTSDRPYQCDQCGKSFFAASALKVHLRLHSGEKPFKCEFCGRQFRQWGDLKYHCISIHSDEKQFQCEFCGKEFARKYSLIVHRRIHTGEKNYRCEFCGKTFRASSYLQNHRRIHTGEKPHPCDVCGKRFRVKSDMKRHLQTHVERKRPVRRIVDIKQKVKIEEELQHESDDTSESITILKTESESGVQTLEYEQDGGLDSIRDATTIYTHLPAHVLIA